ncbi:hypothetical protein F8S13_01430 [Chloroflexia bacterium SDU3-3]|nr:hypothetical protein F8S13_01430 [Chloroflexia bacterium SDU3-3]
MELIDAVLSLKDTTVPGLLVLAGVIFLLLALGAQLTAHIHIPETSQRYSAILGGTLLFSGVILFLVTGGVSKANSAMGTATATVAQPAISPTAPPGTPMIDATPSAMDSPSEPTPVYRSALASVSPEDLFQVAMHWDVAVENGFATPSNWVTRGFTETMVPTMDVQFDNSGLNVHLISGADIVRAVFYNEAAQLNTSDQYMISVDAQAQYQTGCEYGLMFAGDINNGFYRFMIENSDIEGDNNLWYFVDRVSDHGGQGLRHTMVITSTPLLLSEAPSDLHVVAQGQRYLFYVNNTYIDEIYTDRIAGAKVGVSVGLCPNLEAKYKMENFRAYKQPGIPLAKTLPLDFFADDTTPDVHSPRTNHQKAYIPRFTAADFTLNFSTRVLAKTWDPIAIKFRAHEKDYYQLNLLQQGVELEKSDGTTISRAAMPARLLDDPSSSCTLIVRRGRISVFINGLRVAMFEDDANFGAGEILFDGLIDFKEVTVLP